MRVIYQGELQQVLVIVVVTTTLQLHDPNLVFGNWLIITKLQSPMFI